MSCSLARLAAWPLGVALVCASARAQVQLVWTNRCDNGLPGKTHQPVSMALDKSGNVIVAGSSTSSNGDLDYVALKYAPGGTLLWSSRHNSTNTAADETRAMALDGEGNVVVTGTSQTVKLFASDGSLAWAADYGGRSVVVGGNGDAYVTGFLTNDFSTVRLNGSKGTNIWLRTYDYKGRADQSDLVAVDAAGRVFVVGSIRMVIDPRMGELVGDTLISYTSEGATRWMRERPSLARTYSIAALLPDGTGGGLVSVNSEWVGGSPFVTSRFAAASNTIWDYPGISTANGGSLAYGQENAAVIDQNGNYYLVSYIGDPEKSVIVVVKLGPDGTQRWYRFLGEYATGLPNAANAAAVLPGGAVCVAGQIESPATHRDFITLAYDADGRQLWSQRYNGRANGHDEARAEANPERHRPDGRIFFTPSFRAATLAALLWTNSGVSARCPSG